MHFDGSQFQNEIYVTGESPWPVGADEWEALAAEKLESGPFGYIAGGAGNESTLRANRQAFERHRLRPRMLAGNSVRDLSVEVLGTPSPFPFFLAPVGVLSIAQSRRRTRSGARRGGVAGPIHPFQRRVALDRGSRGCDGRRAAVVPALLGQRPRGGREPRA